MQRGKRLQVGIVALAAVVALLPFAATASTATAPDASYDETHYRGARASLYFLPDDGRTKQPGRILRSVDGVVQLPASWANRYCARAVVLINGMPADAQPRQCDTNGDALLHWRFRDLELLAGGTVTLWVSDPVTRYRVTHPSIRVR